PHLSSASSTHPAIPTLPLHDALPIYGWRWIDYADSPESEERDHMRRSIQAIERACGRRPVGWYTGRVSENTRRLVVEEGGFLYEIGRATRLNSSHQIISYAVFCLKKK